MATTITIDRTDGPFGAVVHGVDLGRDLQGSVVDLVRDAWLTHQVLVFPDQHLSDADLVEVAGAFGPIGDDPYFVPISGSTPVVALTREADETCPIFADVWHSDWSFLASPPAGTLLYGVDIPPTGGDTLYADQYGAYDSLPDDLKARIGGVMGVHSARRGYSKQGQYGDRDVGRSMAISSSDDALATQLHPLARVHPETGRIALYCSLSYTIGIDGMDADEAGALLGELFAHVARPELILRHRWSPGMVVLWDNRCLLHAATGGYEGHRRELHRLTIAERPGQAAG